MKISQIFIICLILFKVKNSSISNCDYDSYYSFGYYCQECDDGYKLKEEDGTCIACESGKIGYDNYCFNKIENCEEYGLYAEGEKCSGCKIGYALSKDLSKCNKCKDGEISYGGFSCFKPIEHCDDYFSDNTCRQCEDDYYLQDNKCSKCKDDQRSDGKICYEKIDNCDYDSNTYYQGYNGQYCSQCKSGDKPYLTTGGTQCNNCGVGKYSLDGKCIDEIEYCMEYASETECLRCIIGFQISDKKCVPCVSPYRSQNDGKTCFLEHLYCQYYDYEGNCIYCYDGYKLDSSKKCIKTNAGGINIQNSFNFKINILALLLFTLF